MITIDQDLPNETDNPTTPLPIPVTLRLTTLEELKALWAFLYLPGDVLHEALLDYYQDQLIDDEDLDLIDSLKDIDNYGLWDRVSMLLELAEHGIEELEA